MNVYYAQSCRVFLNDKTWVDEILLYKYMLLSLNELEECSFWVCYCLLQKYLNLQLFLPDLTRQMVVASYLDAFWSLRISLGAEYTSHTSVSSVHVPAPKYVLIPALLAPVPQPKWAITIYYPSGHRLALLLFWHVVAWSYLKSCSHMASLDVVLQLCILHTWLQTVLAFNPCNQLLWLIIVI